MEEASREKVRIGLDKCTGCGRCVSLCPSNALEMHEKAAFLSYPDLCTECGICEDQCPTEAISISNVAGEMAIDRTAIAAPVSLPHLATWAEDITDALGLGRPPLGVKLITPGEPIPEGFVEFDAPMRHCVSLHVASHGLALSVPARRHACSAAKAAFGIAELPDKVRSGKVPYMHGLASSEQAAARTMAEVPRLPLGSTIGTIVAPLSSFSIFPDVVILIVEPKQAMWVANALMYETGGPRIAANFAGMQASCADVTAIPIKTNEVNFSLGCYGCRSAGKLEDDEMYVGIPFSKLETVIKGLGGLRKAMGKLNKVVV